MKLNEDDKLKWMNKISFERHGVVGVDVKSHKTNTTIPYPAITKGNDIQDRNCEDVKYWPKIDKYTKWRLSCIPEPRRMHGHWTNKQVCWKSFEATIVGTAYDKTSPGKNIKIEGRIIQTHSGHTSILVMRDTTTSRSFVTCGGQRQLN